jgi:ankyrin repeat protein
MPSEAFLRIKALCSDAFYLYITLCEDEESSESELISQLESVLRKNPEVLNERDNNGKALLHFAAIRRSVEFIKVLVETNGGLEYVKAADRWGCLPIHRACINCNVEAAKYLHSICPESINIADNDGQYPLHCAIWYSIRGTDKDLENLIQFLLLHYPDAVSKPTMYGDLALHLACGKHFEEMDIVKLVYNAYPQAIRTRGSNGKTLLDCCRNIDTRSFFEAQLEWESQAREQRQPDEHGWIPIHRFLHSTESSVGTVKLMISANPKSAKACDSKGFIPLHYACKFGHVDAAKFLVDFDKESMKQVTLNGDLPLHIACREGKFSVINFILETSDYGVSLRNKDGKLPIQLLLCADVNRDCRLLRAHLDVLERLNPNSVDSHDEVIS